MPMIWTAGNLTFLAGVGIGIAFLVFSEIREARREKARRARTGEAKLAPRNPWQERRPPVAALRRISAD